MKLILFSIALLLFSHFPAHAGILNIQQVTSPKGIKAWLVEDHTVPAFSMRYAFRGAGAANDPETLQGLSRLLSNTLDEGAGNLTSEQFQALLNDKSIGLSFYTTRDDFGGELKTLTKNKDQAFDLLKLSLTAPRFEQAAIDRMIAANIARIRSDMTDPDWMAARLMNAVIFKNHPYGMNSGGTLSSLPRIQAEDLRRKLRSDLSRNRLIISVAGDITKEELALRLDEVFSGLPEKAENKTIPNIEFGEASTILFRHDIPQTLISATLPGIRINDPDYHAAEIMNFILGSSGFGSRLTEVIREQNGLTYGIYTGMEMMDHAALFTLSTSTKADTGAKLLDLTKKEFERIKTEDVSDKEIKDARSYLIGSTPLSLSSNDQIASMMLAFQRYNLPTNYLDLRAQALRSVTKADIKKVAQRLLDTSKLTVTLVGAPKDIQPTATLSELPNVR